MTLPRKLENSIALEKPHTTTGVHWLDMWDFLGELKIIYIYPGSWRETLVRSQVVANFNFLLVFLSIISTFPFAPNKEKSWLLASY